MARLLQRRFVRRRRVLGELTSIHREDPLAGVANLFDASIVFAVGLMVALMQAFSLAQLFNPRRSSPWSSATPHRRTAFDREEPQGDQVSRITPEQKAGEGTQLGVAYRLPDGSVVYVPEAGASPAAATSAAASAAAAPLQAAPAGPR